MFDWVINAPLMMTVARYWMSISNKTETVKRPCLKTHFILDNGSTCKMNHKR